MTLDFQFSKLLAREQIIEALHAEAVIYEKRCNYHLSGQKIYLAPKCHDKSSVLYPARPSAKTTSPVSSLRSKYFLLDHHAVGISNFK